MSIAEIDPLATAFAALDDQRFTTKAVRVYLHVSGKPLSSPGNRTSVRCNDPGDLSLDHIMTVSASPHDYACIKIAHFASHKNFERDSVGQTIIYVKDVVEYKITEHNSAKDVKDHLHRSFGAKPTNPTYKLSVVALTTSKVWIDIPRPALKALRRVKDVLFNQLDALNNMKYDAGKAKLVLSFPQEEDDIRCNLISALLGREANLRKEGVNYPNPLDFWFQEENGGRRETLFPSHVGHKDDFPKLATSMKVSRYLTHDQQLVHQMVGSTYDETLQVDEYSDGTLKAEALAINCLHHPKSRPQEMAATEDLLNASKAKYTYQLQFDDSKVKLVDILARLPALGRFAAEKSKDYDAPVFCQEIFGALDSSKKGTFYRLSKVPAGLAFINGVAGSGKSTFFSNDNPASLLCSL